MELHDLVNFFSAIEKRMLEIGKIKEQDNAVSSLYDEVVKS